MNALEAHADGRPWLLYCILAKQEVFGGNKFKIIKLSWICLNSMCVCVCVCVCVCLCVCVCVCRH